MNQSVIKHKASMYYVPFHEDFLLISKACTFKKLNKNGKPGNASPYCKAFILAILENWTNEKRDKGEELSIYMSYPQWVDAMYGMFGRNVIIDSIDELIGERLISREPYKMFGRDSFQYRLNDQELNKRIKALPDDPFKNKRVAFRNKPDTSLKVNGDPFKSKRNIESTQTPNIESTEESTSTVAAPPACADAHSLSPSVSEKESSSSQEQLSNGRIATVSTQTPPADNKQAVPVQTTQPGTIGKTPQGKKPLISVDALTQAERDYWGFWCSSKKIPPDLNETAYGHVQKLAPHITTQEDFESHLEYTRKELVRQNAQDKRVHLGNLANTLDGWWDQTRTRDPYDEWFSPQHIERGQNHLRNRVASGRPLSEIALRLQEIGRQQEAEYWAAQKDSQEEDHMDSKEALLARIS